MNGRSRTMLLTALLLAALICAGTAVPALARSMSDLERGSTMKTAGPMDAGPEVITLSEGEADCVDPNYFLSLDGDGWLLSEDTQYDWEHAYKISVPSSISGALCAAGKLEDPTVGLNDAAAKELGTHSWFYRKEFEYAGSGKNVMLCFDGVADRMNVYLNGEKVGSHQGMFGGPYIDVTGTVQQGKNTLVVELKPVLPYGQTVVFNCSYAWHYADLPPIGIWQSVYVRDRADAEPDSPFITTVSHETGTMDFYTEIVPSDASATVNGTLSVTVKPKNFEGSAYTASYPVNASAPGSAYVRLRFDIPGFRLWWPNGYGDQPLYELITVFEAAGGGRAVERSDFAVRTLSLEPGTYKESTSRYNRTAVINGRRVFLRGANWCTIDATMHFTREDYDRILVRAKDENLNAFRSWGGGLVETDEFYGLCDEYGIMVYQEWPCCWDSQLSQPADVLYETVILNVKRLRNHPSLMVYGGGNEGTGAVNDPVLNNMGRLTYQYDGTRDFWRQDGGAGAYGIIHDHIHWGGEDPEHYLSAYADAGYNLHEYGLDAMMNVESIAKYAAKDEMARWPIDQKGVIAYHTATFNGMKGWNPTPYGYDIDNFIYRASKFVTVDSLESLVTGSQLAQAMSDYPAVVNARIADPDQSMIFIYKFNDVYPGASWSIVDWYGAPKLAYWFIQDAFSPLLAAPKLYKYDIAEDNECTLPIYLVDDAGELAGKNWNVTVKAYDRDMSKRVSVTFGGSGTSDAPVYLGDVVIPGNAVSSCPLYIVCDVTDETGELLSRYYIPLNCDVEPDSLYMTPAAKLDMNVSGNTVTVTNSDTVPAAGVNLLVPSASDTIRLSDNYFWLEPGETKVLTVSDPGAVKGLGGFNVADTSIRKAPADVGYIEGISRDYDSVELTWEYQGKDKVRFFEIYVNGAEAARVSGSARTARIGGLSENTSYTFQVIAVNEAMLRSVKSAKLELSTKYDRTGPRVTSVTREGNTLLIGFSEKLDPASAADLSHYVMDGGTILSADLQEDGSTVKLETRPDSGDFTVTLTGISDTSVSGNMSLKYVYSADTELRGLWRLDGQSDRFSDESGYHAGSFSYGKALPVEGRFGEGRHIEGRGIELGKTGLGLSGNTYSFWFYPEEFSGYNIFLAKGDKTTGHFEFYTNEGELKMFSPDIGDLSFGIDLKKDISMREWHHFCFVCGNREIRCYIDGEQRGKISAGDTAASDATLILGSLLDGTFSAKGAFDEAVILASELDQDSVKALMNGSLLPYAAVNESAVRLLPGAEYTLTLSDIFSADHPGARITWSTSDGSVAAVDASGTVRAVSEGNAVITFSAVDGERVITDVAAVRVGGPLPDNPDIRASAGITAAKKKSGTRKLIIASAAGGAVVLCCAAAVVIILKKKRPAGKE